MFTTLGHAPKKHLLLDPPASPLMTRALVPHFGVRAPPVVHAECQVASCAGMGPASPRTVGVLSSAGSGPQLPQCCFRAPLLYPSNMCHHTFAHPSMCKQNQAWRVFAGDQSMCRIPRPASMQHPLSNPPPSPLTPPPMSGAEKCNHLVVSTVARTLCRASTQHHVFSSPTIPAASTTTWPRGPT